MTLHRSASKRCAENSLNKCRGFTLVELLIVMVLVGIVVGIAVPGFNNLLQQARFDRGIDNLAQSITVARNLALNVTSDQQVVLCPSSSADDATPTCRAAADTDYSDGWIVFIDCNGNELYETVASTDCDDFVGNDTEELLHSKSGPAPISLSATTTDRIVFNRFGRPDSAVTFEFKKDGVDFASLTVNNIGRVAVQYQDYF